MTTEVWTPSWTSFHWNEGILQLLRSEAENQTVRALILVLNILEIFY